MSWESALQEWVEEPYKLGHLLGFEKLSEIHGEWVKLFLNVPASGQTVLMAHRNSYKTTCGLVALTLLYMLYPNIRVLIVRKNLINAEKIVLAMQKIFNSDIFKIWSDNRHGIANVETAVWSRSQLSLAFKKKLTAEPSLQATGVGGSITGAHFDYIWCDDIVTDADRYSPAERESTKNYVYELANIIEPFGSRMYTGTTWHQDDAFSVLPEAIKYPVRSVKINGIDEAWIEEQKKNMPNSLWCANYELKHVFDGDTIGAFQKVDKFTAEYLVAFIDTSFSDSSNSDKTALSIVGFSLTGYNDSKACPIEFTGMSWQKSVTHPDVVREMLLFLDRYKPIETCVESQLADSTSIFIDRFRLAENQLGLNIKNHWTTFHQTKNKHERIMQNIDSNKTRIFVLSDTDAGYLNPIVNYSKKSSNDDEIDSLAGAINLWLTSDNLKNYIYQYEQLKKQRAI